MTRVRLGIVAWSLPMRRWHQSPGAAWKRTRATFSERPTAATRPTARRSNGQWTRPRCGAAAGSLGELVVSRRPAPTVDCRRAPRAVRVPESRIRLVFGVVGCLMICPAERPASPRNGLPETHCSLVCNRDATALAQLARRTTKFSSQMRPGLGEKPQDEARGAARAAQHGGPRRLRAGWRPPPDRRPEVRSTSTRRTPRSLAASER